MRKRATNTSRTARAAETAEPVGIIISSGPRGEDTPRFAAYVWGPVPEAELDAELTAVA